MTMTRLLLFALFWTAAVECHAWAPSSQQEPRCRVGFNRVEPIVQPLSGGSIDIHPLSSLALVAASQPDGDSSSEKTIEDEGPKSLVDYKEEFQPTEEGGGDDEDDDSSFSQHSSDQVMLLHSVRTNITISLREHNCRPQRLRQRGGSLGRMVERKDRAK